MAKGGTPGSSRRCQECALRRKKCDLQEPACRRCVKSGLKCSGAKTATVYIHRQANAFHSKTQRALLLEALRDRPASAQQLRGLYKDTLSHVQHLQKLVATYRLGSTLTINSHLTGNALHGQVYSALLGEFQPQQGRKGIFSGDRVHAGMRHYSSVALCIRGLLPVSSLRVPLLDRAILSLLMLYYGRLHGNAGLVEASCSSYTSILGEYRRCLLKIDLQRTDSGNSHQILACISTAMQLFEHLNEIEPYRPGQMAHIDGALELLKQSVAHGLESSSHFRGIFSGLRGIAVFAAINRRSPIFLSEKEWIGPPFHDRQETTRQDLLNLGLRIPTLLTAVDGLLFKLQADMIEKVEFAPACDGLLADVGALRSEFEKWLLRFKSTVPGPLYWPFNQPVTLDMYVPDDECKLKAMAGSTYLQFPCGPIAGLLAQYWAFQLELFMASMDIQESLLKYSESQAVQTSASAGLVASRRSAEDTTRLILEAQPYLFSCFEGLIALQPPLTVVTRYFQRTNE